MIKFTKTYYYPKLPDIIWKRSKFLIGLTGTIAAGKSSFTKCFKNAGAEVINADKIAKSFLNTNYVQDLLVKTFGHKIISPNGNVKNELLAKIIFAKKQKRKELNKIIHPIVLNNLKKYYEEAPEGKIMIYDTPLLFETKHKLLFDLTIVIDAPQKLRYTRAYERNKWSLEEFINREKSQFSGKKKKRLADLVIENINSVNFLQEVANNIYKMILKINKHHK